MISSIKSANLTFICYTSWTEALCSVSQDKSYSLLSCQLRCTCCSYCSRVHALGTTVLFPVCLDVVHAVKVSVINLCYSLLIAAAAWNWSFHGLVRWWVLEANAWRLKVTYSRFSSSKSYHDPHGRALEAAWRGWWACSSAWWLQNVFVNSSD